MQCARLKHFVRINSDGTIGKCGHMVGAPKFQSFAELSNSTWTTTLEQQMAHDQWPTECRRCGQSEQLGQDSIRIYSNNDDACLSAIDKDYLIVGGVLDNVCNSACQSCNSKLSTKIGSLTTSNYIKINNEHQLHNLPWDKIVKLDINGGEPTASPTYQKLLDNLPPNLKYLRINTNGSRILPNLNNILDKGIDVTITVSLDGIGRVHDYVRWPIKWQTVEANIKEYQSYPINLNTWTTVHALNVGDLQNIINFTQENQIEHSWALLEQPDVLSVKYSNHFTRTAQVPDFLKDIVASGEDNTVPLQLWTFEQDRMRNINLWDYYK